MTLDLREDMVVPVVRQVEAIRRLELRVRHLKLRLGVQRILQHL